MTLDPLSQRRLLLETVASGIESGPYGADWDSLKDKQVPAWYEDGKFGIFIHWGVYSVPAFENEWYPRNMYIQGSAPFEHHREVYGEQNVFGYKDFIPEFTAENFDADTWANVVPTSRGAICRAGGRASRRVPHVRLHLDQVEGDRDGAAPGCDRRAR